MKRAGQSKKRQGRPATPKPKPKKTSRPRTSRAPVSLPAKSGQWLIVSRPQLAELMGVHPDTVTDYTRKGMPVITMGGHGVESAYDAVGCLDWWRSKQGKNAKDEAQARAANASAQVNELKLQRERGELVAREDVVAAGQAYTKAWTAMVRALPRQLVQAGVVSRDVEPQITERVKNILTEISGFKTLEDVERVALAATA